MNEPMAMVAGWREIARICGFYKNAEPPVATANLDGARLRAKIKAMSDAELLETIDKLSPEE